MLEESDSHSTELFEPSVEVIKTGPVEAQVGETITYEFTINNTSSADSPDLILDSVTDTVLGDLTATASAAGCATLASGGSCNFAFDYTIQPDDPNPLVNVVTLHYHPDGFPNDITDDDDHSLEIIFGEGCTPGFWRNHHDEWVTYSPGDDFDSVFGVDLFDPDKTLGETVELGGGDFKKLARHATAALLNASADLNFAFTEAEVIALVQAAVATGSAEPYATQLAEANESDCPLGDGGSGGIVIPPVFLPLLRRWKRDEEELDI